jgi:hypothetical protein
MIGQHGTMTKSGVDLRISHPSTTIAREPLFSSREVVET